MRYYDCLLSHAVVGRCFPPEDKTGELSRIPTLMPAKEEVKPLPASYIAALISGKNLSKTQAAAREMMRLMAIKFVMLHGPIVGACILLNITSLILSG